MANGKEKSGAKSGDKLQELLPPEREEIHQGQQFDEMQRQHKNPHGGQQGEEKFPRIKPSSESRGAKAPANY